MRITRNHGLGKEEAKRRVDGLADELGRKMGVSSEWQGDQLEVSGTGVNGYISVADDRIDVNVNLGFALVMFEGTIRSAVENAMDEHLV